ncbi:MAG: hypothetical protein ACTSXJ_07110 [Candidatus Baldrarchaeia archaeon]
MSALLAILLITLVWTLDAIAIALANDAGSLFVASMPVLVTLPVILILLDNIENPLVLGIIKLSIAVISLLIFVKLIQLTVFPE